MLTRGTITTPAGEMPCECPDCGNTVFHGVDNGCEPTHHDWVWECADCGYTCKDAREAERKIERREAAKEKNDERE